jgi:ABC-type spermidine/putrescine transport system permease subunit II
MKEILMIPKIAVPVIIIGLGMLDFSKAVLASKEDEMRKAQSTFIKRVLIGVTVFFVPTIINVLMYIMDVVLGVTSTNCL